MLDLAGLAVCGVRDRCVRPTHRGLAGWPFNAHPLRPGRLNQTAFTEPAGFTRPSLPVEFLLGPIDYDPAGIMDFLINY